jgi:hypothetical protein
VSGVVGTCGAALVDGERGESDEAVEGLWLRTWGSTVEGVLGTVRPPLSVVWRGECSTGSGIAVALLKDGRRNMVVENGSVEPTRQLWLLLRSF